ncbi:helix-turn-helix domain-containing protein [Nocardia sp. NPDC051787]|uniref:helix-turn-helix domain-containing protein n=1 Tax=Nocardia sp. NPDC051787 TaxID=3155415 RepID=UPI00341DC9B3
MTALDIARALIGFGIPVFVAHKAVDAEGGWDPDGGTDHCGYDLPRRWQLTRPDPAVLEQYRDGDALGMVCGHGIDALDYDPRHAGDVTRNTMLAAGVWPASYGRTATPSGGGHEFVAALGVRSRDGVRPGLDVKAGVDGQGCGFVFLPPTRKRSKAEADHGEVRTYEWVVEPELDRLAEDGPDDDSGAAIANMVDELRPEPLADEPPGEHVEYSTLTADQRERVDRYMTRTVDGIRDELRAAKNWTRGYRDEKGRGWEKLCSDAAYRLGQLAREHWNSLTVEQAGTVLLDTAPRDYSWTESNIREKWRLQRNRRPLKGLPTALADLRTELTVLDAEPIGIEQARAVFRKWLGAEFDTGSLDVVLATLAVERLDGDPLWRLLVAGSGNAKTETVAAAEGAGACVTSTIRSEGALLSGTSRRERGHDATGGLLRKLGDRGVLVIKDVTTVLSMNRDGQAEVLAALREVYDGQWERNIGSDGGRSLKWTGRIAVIGAVTTAWDKAHTVVAAMGDRFVLVRTDSRKHRIAAGRRAIGNTGNEVAMRQELRNAVAGVLAGMNTEPMTVTDILLAAANLVTVARTGVEFDYRGDVIDAHNPEMPTRFAKQLTQVVRGAVAIGIGRDDALRLAIRCARDSMPPLRLAIIDYLAEHPGASTSEVRKGIEKPRATVDRQLQALHVLGVVECDEQEYSENGRSRWFYRLAEGIDPTALNQYKVCQKN